MPQQTDATQPPFHIVLNYRREDASGHAGRLYDDLAKRFGDDRVFMDIDAIEPGVDFAEAIDKAVGAANAFLAVIGRQWLTCTDDKGARRLDNPDDFVRLEIEAALRPDVLVIPVLVQDAEMPPSAALPPSLAPLARRNAIELRDSSWRYDADRLLQTLEREEAKLRGASAPPPPPRGEPGPAPSTKRPRWLVPAAVGAVVLVVAVVLAIVLTGRDDGKPGPSAGGAVPAGALVFSRDGSLFTNGGDGADVRVAPIGQTPDWSADGTIAFARRPGLWTVDTAGRTKLLTEDLEDGSPAWSPDGSKIAFDRLRKDANGDPVRTGGGTTVHDVWLLDAADPQGTQRRLTSGEGAAGSGGQPDWSSDGRIAFTRQGTLFVMNEDGRGQASLSKGLEGRVQRPAWSPDGASIAFELRTAEGSDIYVVRGDGDDPRNLTEGRAQHPSSPTWSPDGSEIAFAADDGLYVMPSDGGDIEPVETGEGFKTPDWRPGS